MHAHCLIVLLYETIKTARVFIDTNRYSIVQVHSHKYHLTHEMLCKLVRKNYTRISYYDVALFFIVRIFVVLYN